MAAPLNFNGLAFWQNAENSLQLVNLTMPFGDTIVFPAAPIAAVTQRRFTLQVYRASLTASLSAFPALNDGAFEVGMEIFAPFVLFDVEY